MKSCLVFLDQEPTAPARLEFAVDLASRLEAHLTALPVTLEPAYTFAASGVASAELWAQQLEASRAASEELKQKAEARLARAELSYEVRPLCLPLGALSRMAALHARYGDLSILGHAVDTPGAAALQDLFDGALFESGRPVLVAPPRADAGKVLQRVMIAWDASKFSARAAGDALPLLKMAEEVCVAVVDPQVSMVDHGQEPGADIALSLSRHGVKVEVRQVADVGRSVPEALSTLARDWDAGMIVMGGFGHSKLRESLFGGVSYDMLERAEFPIFMSH